MGRALGITVLSLAVVGSATAVVRQRVFVADDLLQIMLKIGAGVALLGGSLLLHKARKRAQSRLCPASHTLCPKCGYPVPDDGDRLCAECGWRPAQVDGTGRLM